MRKELALGRIQDDRLLAKSAVIYNKVKQRLQEEKTEKEKEKEDKMFKRRQKEKINSFRNINDVKVRDKTEDVDEIHKRGIKRRNRKWKRRRKNRRRNGRRRNRRKKNKRKRKKRGRRRKRRKRKKDWRMNRKIGKRLNKWKRKNLKWRINKKMGRRKGRRRKRRRRKRKRRRRRKGRKGRRKLRKRKGKGRRNKRRRKWRRKMRRRMKKFGFGRRRKGRQKWRRKMRRRRKKLEFGQKSKNLNLVQILKRLNQADYRSAAIRGTSIELANRLVRRLMRAHRVARAWRSLRRRWPLVRSVKVFTVLLRRCERIITTIRKRGVPTRRRPALIRRLRLALLYLDVILVDLRRAVDTVRARAGGRVFAMLKLAVRTQRAAVWQAIHGTSRRTKQKKQKKPRGI